MRLFMAILLSASVLTAGCTTAKHPAAPMVRVEAETDLRCTSDQITITALIGGRYRADGCGRSAVYHTACEQLRCAVALEDEDSPAWRDRPTLDSPDYQR